MHFGSQALVARHDWISTLLNKALYEGHSSVGVSTGVLVSVLLQFDCEARAHVLQRHAEDNVCAVLLDADEVLQSFA